MRCGKKDRSVLVSGLGKHFSHGFQCRQQQVLHRLDHGHATTEKTDPIKRNR